jgi:hypothetical protein
MDIIHGAIGRTTPIYTVMNSTCVNTLADQFGLDLMDTVNIANKIAELYNAVWTAMSNRDEKENAQAEIACSK